MGAGGIAMQRLLNLALLCSAILLVLSVAHAQQRQAALQPIDAMVPSRYDFGLPAWAPRPMEPAANPTTPAKVELGRYLFYDTRLSRDGTMACASCHEQARAFTDGRAVSRGVTGESTPRNSMSLVNVAYFPVLTWANPLLKHLEQQALVPLLGQEPVELGLAGKDAEIVQRLAVEPLYRRLFAAAFPEADGEISLATVVRALSAFERSIVSMRSPYDRYRYEGDADALSDSAIRGEALFFSERLECHHCHNGLNLADTVLHERNKAGEIAFHNTGLYNLDGNGAYPANNTGIAEITGRPEDMGRFRAPSLRNVAVTAPYMHDGSIPTLDAVIDHYAAGGRTIASGPHAGIGRINPYKSSFAPGFTLTQGERADLIAFLTSLTDEALLHDPRFANPWPKKETAK
ncbi:di-heme enzyme [Sphingomonas pokkalii]|uniref:Di-heme enzyme n=2 Tax=Sphingomonas pokkalii TaxID=2175090 RepID=A0A2U0SCB4_9SPHN|nr:di-heme enzyme [Sphingomonas pokkalii]